MRPKRNSHQHRRGIIVVLVAILIPVVMILLGFSVDLAQIQQARTELRVVADLSAKAAVGELSRTQNINKAKNAARDVCAINAVAGTSITLDDADIVFGRSERQVDGTWLFQAGVTPNNSVQVWARRTNTSANGALPLSFGKLIGRTSVEPEFSATASFLDIDICLVLDRSSSMKLSVNDLTGLMTPSDPRFCDTPWADSRWVALENSVTQFTSHLNSTLAAEHVGLVTFASNYTSCGSTNSQASTDQVLNQDLSLIDQAMADRTATIWNGATEIDAGISSARTMLTGPQSREFATKVMIVFTDGVYTGADPVPVAQAASDDGIIIHTITFGDGANQLDMQAVASAGYGNHYHAPDAAALDTVFQQISAALAILTE